MKDSYENTFSLSWSVNEECVYLTDESADEFEVRIQYLGDSKKLNKKDKIELIKRIAESLSKAEIKGETPMTTQKLKEAKTEQCFCQSFYDENNELQNCICGKCFRSMTKHPAKILLDAYGAVSTKAVRDINAAIDNALANKKLDLLKTIKSMKDKFPPGPEDWEAGANVAFDTVLSLLDTNKL